MWVFRAVSVSQAPAHSTHPRLSTPTTVTADHQRHEASRWEQHSRPGASTGLPPSSSGRGTASPHGPSRAVPGLCWSRGGPCTPVCTRAGAGCGRVLQQQPGALQCLCCPRSPEARQHRPTRQLPPPYLTPAPPATLPGARGGAVTRPRWRVGKLGGSSGKRNHEHV